MQDAVDHGDHTSRTGEDLGPFGEGTVGGEQGTFGLIALVDELEEYIPHAGVVREISDFVDAEQVRVGIEAQAAAQG